VTTRSRVGKRQRGIAAIEMAVVTPILLMLLLGVAEFGRLLLTQNMLDKSVRDGVRHLAANVTSVTGQVNLGLAADATRNLVVYGAPVNTGVPLIEGMATAGVNLSLAGDYVVVNATCPYVPLLGAIPLFGSGHADAVIPTQLAATARMRVL
jgi:uncharacterized membrane protein